MSARPFGPRGICAGIRVEGVSRHRLAQQHADPVRRLVHVGLVGRPAPVQVVQVEAGSAEVRQGFELLVGQGFPQPGRGVEGEVMVDELAQIGVGGRYLRVLLGVGLGLRGRGGLLRRGHLLGQLLEVIVSRTGSRSSGSNLVKRPAITSLEPIILDARSHHVPWYSPVPVDLVPGRLSRSVVVKAVFTSCGCRDRRLSRGRGTRHMPLTLLMTLQVVPSSAGLRRLSHRESPTLARVRGSSSTVTHTGPARKITVTASPFMKAPRWE